jgi:hypothetical protein
MYETLVNHKREVLMEHKVRPQLTLSPDVVAVIPALSDLAPPRMSV